MKTTRKILTVLLAVAMLCSMLTVFTSAANKREDAVKYLYAHTLKNGTKTGDDMYSIFCTDEQSAGYGSLIACLEGDDTELYALNLSDECSITIVFLDYGETIGCVMDIPYGEYAVDLQPTEIYRNTSFQLAFEDGQMTQAQEAEVNYNVTEAFHSAIAFLNEQLLLGGYSVADLGFVNYEHDYNCESEICEIYGAECPGAIFADMPKADDWSHNAIDWAVLNGITTGATATTFEPESECTRAQIVTFLWRFEGCPEPQTTVNPFTDVKTSDYFYKAVLWAYSNGITTGATATTFEPESKCTRAQVVTFLWRDCGYEKVAPTASFTDLIAGTYYLDAVNWAVSNGITNGTGNGKFSPDDACNRAQVVTFLYRAQSLAE